MSKKRTQPVTLADALRQAIKAAAAEGTSRYRISKETGLSESLLSHFMLGDSDLSMASVQLVLDALELQVELKSTRHGRKGATK